MDDFSEDHPLFFNIFFPAGILMQVLILPGQTWTLAFHFFLMKKNYFKKTLLQKFKLVLDN
jgi:hypothetical protein